MIGVRQGVQALSLRGRGTERDGGWRGVVEVIGAESGWYPSLPRQNSRRFRRWDRCQHHGVCSVALGYIMGRISGVEF